MIVIEDIFDDKITDNDWKYYLSYKPHDYIRETATDLKNKNRFFVDEHFTKLIYAYVFDVRSRRQAQHYISPLHSNELFRARIYHEKDAEDRKLHPENFGAFQGYDADKSGAPDPSKAKIDDGRANPRGISYLYAASDIKTAIMEIKAKTCQYVSVAKIKLTKDIFLIDFSGLYSYIDMNTPQKTDWINEFVLSLNSLFDRPAEEDGDYYLCQYICEYLKNSGIDGVIYKSSMMINNKYQGTNIVIFDKDKYEIISSKMYYIFSYDVNFS